MNPFRRYRDWKRDEFVLCYADPALGGADYCAAQFLSKDMVDVPLVYHQQGITSDMTPQLHLELERIYDATKIKPVVSFERLGGGTVELERLQTLNRNGKYRIYTQYKGVGTTEAVETDVRMGHDVNSATRGPMLALLKDAIDNRVIRIYDKLTVDEMFSFIVKQGLNGNWKAQAEVGAHDDLIMSLAGVWQMYQTEVKPVAQTHRRPQQRRSRFHV